MCRSSLRNRWRKIKERQHVTSRIVTKDVVENVLNAVEQARIVGRIDNYHYLNNKAITLFGAFTGQRPLATIARLTVGQFREATKMEKPVFNVQPAQDKVRMETSCAVTSAACESDGDSV